MTKKLFSAFLFVFITLQVCGEKKPMFTYVQLNVDHNSCIIKLYNETPLHRDNFVKLINEGLYDSTLFHRVIKNFVAQGGDPQSKNAPLGTKLGNGDLNYTVPAEIRDSLFHKKGALAAARDDNPEKASSATQFYLVQGKRYTAKELDRMEKLKLNGKKIPSYQRQAYETIGGTPFLDGNYTVFGEVVKGISLIDSIASLPTDSNDRPLQNVVMELAILSPLASRKLEAELKNEPYKPNIFRRFLDLFAK